MGEDLNRIQDSYYYQDYSYEVQVGVSLGDYLRELQKEIQSTKDSDHLKKYLSQVRYQSQSEQLQQMCQTIQVMIHLHQNLRLHLSTSSKLNLKEEESTYI